jgi:hypothetical protein
MGVWHFMSLGESPGAVTSALAYINQRLKQDDVAFFGSDSGRYRVKKVSGIVIFTTPEVRHSRLPARDKKYIRNSCGSDKGQEHSLGDAAGNLITFEVVQEFIATEFWTMLQEERGKLYWLQASYHDLDFNLRQLVRAFCVLSPPGKTGREVWVNLTGGSNVMNLAALLITVMSGVTGRAYYTYTRDIRLLRPASETDFWYDVPVLKLNFDRDYEAILQVLAKQDDWMDSDDLFKQVKQQRWQFRAAKDTFAPDYLNKLDGWLIERDGLRIRLLRPAGERFLDLMADDLVRAVVYKERLSEPLSPTEVFEEVMR